jgi:hypothetical protein
MAKAKKEADNHTIEIKPLTNVSTWSDFVANDAYMLFPNKLDWRQRFTYTLLEWASKEDSLEITDFTIAMKMRRATLYEWADKHKDIKDAFEMAKLILASRRKKGALLRKFDKDVVFKDLHKYDPEWHEINKYHSDMKKEEEKQAHTFIISDVKPRIVSKEEMLSDSSEGEV